jgi:hypothetical protein
VKYVLLDTNIVIDMVIDRRNQVTDAILSSFIKLLDYNEIRLIVPEIVKVETKRHLDEELALVGKQLHNVMKNIDDLYGVATHTIDGLDIREYKRHSKQELAKAYDMYEKNEPKYKKELVKTIDMVFDHSNSLVIACDNFLSNAVTTRRIFKRAPFHIEKKDSYGDGLIAEILINLGRYVPLTPLDEILFVTGNYTDFCVGKGAKTTLLPDIINDIKKAGIPCPVKCVNTFGQLVGDHLRENVKAANLSDEFAKELKAQYEEEMEQLAIEVRNMDRESVDLTPMNGYNDKLEDALGDSEFATDIVNSFNELNEIYSTIQNECCDIFYEELIESVKSASIMELLDILKKFKIVFDEFPFLPCIGGSIDEDYTTEDLIQVLNWLDNQLRLMKDIEGIDCLPDSIYYGDIIDIKNCEFETLKFSLDGLYLSPEEGSSEDIDMRIYSPSGEKLAYGCISVTYGFIDFDEDGGIGDGASDDIVYNYSKITDVLKGVADKWREFVDKQLEIYNLLVDEF